MTTISSTALGNPMIPTAQPHLIIGNKIICRQVLTALRQVAAIPPYQKALQKQYHWTPQEFRSVHWTVFQAALKIIPWKTNDALSSLYMTSYHFEP